MGQFQKNVQKQKNKIPRKLKKKLKKLEEARRKREAEGQG